MLSISEMIKSIFSVQGANADCQLASFSYFYLVIVFTAGQAVNIINLVRTCLRTHIGGGRQFSRNICTMVNLFDKAVAEGRDNHCGNEVGR